RRRPNCIARCDSSCRQLAHCIQRSETEVFAKVIWGAQCRKSARWVLLGETSSRSHARSVRALARKRQITARLRKGLPLQGSSLPSDIRLYYVESYSYELAVSGVALLVILTL